MFPLALHPDTVELLLSEPFPSRWSEPHSSNCLLSRASLTERGYNQLAVFYPPFVTKATA